MRMLKKIAITGPESTGKSTLAKQLAATFDGHWVPEIARAYLNQISLPYTKDDLEKIAHLQIDAFEKATRAPHAYLFADTELLVIKIWYEHAFGECPEWFMKAYKEQDFSLYLLTDIDLSWKPDPLREHPHKRKYFFNLFVDELKTMGRPYNIISGKGNMRLQRAVAYIRGL